jgi:hypothetical protein
MTIQSEQNEQLVRAAQDQDPRVMLSKLEIPDAQQHEEKILAPLKRVKKLVEEGVPAGDQLSL